MAGAAHTPGPWAYDPEINRVFSVPTGLCVATMHIEGNAACEEAWPTDASLIAAAPDLLAIIKAVEWGATEGAEEGGSVPACPMCGAEERSGAHAEGCALAAAIAKAEGRS